jgi:hypothetical protein
MSEEPKKPRRESRPKPLVWAILNRESQIELHVGNLAPFLDENVVVAGSGTELLGKLLARETEKALGLRLNKVGHAIQLDMTFGPKPGT